MKLVADAPLGIPLAGKNRDIVQVLKEKKNANQDPELNEDLIYK